MPFKVPGHLLKWRIDELQFNWEDIRITRSGGPWTSYAIDKAFFESWLKEGALDGGAAFREATLVDVRLEGRDVVKAKVKTPEGEDFIRPRAVVAADGVDSAVVAKADLKVKSPPPVTGYGASYELEGVEVGTPYADQLYYGDFIPGGYAYIFPLPGNRVSVGAGSISAGLDVKDYLDRFMKRPEIGWQLEGGRMVAEKAGKVPFTRTVEDIVSGNILVCGDAAAQNLKPLVEGFLPAIICGFEAGRAAGRFVTEGRPVESYVRSVDRKMGLLFRESDKATRLMVEFSNSLGEQKYPLLMGLSCGVFTVEEAMKMIGWGIEPIRQKLMDWNNSRIRRLKTGIIEMAGVSYLRLNAAMGGWG
jgi:flavin-dependent dehydrogenase